VRDFVAILNERKAEVQSHLAFIGRLEAAATGRSAGLGLGPADSEPINILKSGLLVHLYNVVEAVMTKILEEVELEARSHLPSSWRDGLLREWARGRVNLAREITIQQAENRVNSLIREAIRRDALGSIRFKRNAGNWSDDEIARLSERLECSLDITPSIHNRACVVVFENDLSPMKYLRHKRNFLAHGNDSFLDSARHLSVSSLTELFQATSDYMDRVASSWARYLDNAEFLEVAEPVND
tara:strand:+ start:1980 stop:2702 length:723 start_codon:yes stop_codon:yes gene_type:complete